LFFVGWRSASRARASRVTRATRSHLGDADAVRVGDALDDRFVVLAGQQAASSSFVRMVNSQCELRGRERTSAS